MSASTISSYQASGNATKRLEKTGYTHLHTIEVENPNTSPVYIQIFDAAAAADVDLGTTVPTTTRYIPPGDGTENGVRIIDFGNSPLRLGLGLVWAITTARSGSTGPGTACPTNLTLN